MDDSCRSDALLAHSAFLEDLIFWEVVGTIAGYAVGAAIPGVGRVLATAFKKGMALIKNGIMYIPRLNIAVAIPSVAILTDIAQKLPASTTNLFEGISKRYTGLFSGTHSVPGTRIDPIPAGLERVGARLATEGAPYLSHETNRFFSIFNPKNIDEVTKANETWVTEAEKLSSLITAADIGILRAITDIDAMLKKPFSEFLTQAKLLSQELHGKAVLAAEAFSGKHQTDMLAIKGSPLWQKLQDLGLNTKTFINGVLDSDKGKLKIYKALFTEASPKSDLLLHTIRGIDDGTNTQAIGVLRAFLDEQGFAGKWLINPDVGISNDTVRAIFAKNPAMIGWMHDLPGLTDSIELLGKGVITESEFKQILSTNLFHNGPAAGFWGFLTGVLVPDGLAKSADEIGDAARNFFKGTVYTLEKADAGGVMREVVNEAGVVATKYPMPRNFDGISHLILDRLSQATRGGDIKIWFELAGFTKPFDMINNVVVGGAKGTIAQYDLVLKHIDEVVESGLPAGKGGMTTAQAAQAKQMATAAMNRVQILMDNAAQAFKVEGDNLIINFTDSTGEVVNRTFGIDLTNEELFPFVLRFLFEEEAKYGDPFKMIMAL